MVGKQTRKLAFIGIIFAFSLVVSCCYLNPSPWKTTTVHRPRAGSNPPYTSLATVNGYPAISYTESSGFNKTRREHLRYMRARDANGSSWGSPITVVSAKSLSEHHTLAIVNGRPAISHYENISYERIIFGSKRMGYGTVVKYVRAGDADGSSWGSAVTVASASGVSIETRVPLAIVNGHPAIVYPGEALTPWKDWATGKPRKVGGALKYVRAEDADGSSWGNPVILRGGRDPYDFMLEGRHVSLEVVNGCPAISYYETRRSVGTREIGGEIKYIRASNANGSSWGNPITVAGTGDFGGEPSLAVVDGHPAISYHYCSSGVSLLKYVRASNANGSSWGRVIPVDSGGAHSSLEVVNGYPAISYFDFTNNDLKYVQASDADGSSWGTPILVDNSGGGPDSSLEVVNGYPAISFSGCRKFAGSFLRFATLTERGERAAAGNP